MSFEVWDNINQILKKKKNNLIIIMIGKCTMLSSKDLGTNVFRTLMCNVGKPWPKQVLVLFRLAQSVCLVCKVGIE